jgi:hypothetical protein
VNRHQVNAFPAIFARQIGMTVQLDGKGSFSGPSIDGNGILPLLQLRSLTPPVISNSGLALGSPINTTFPAPYGNLGVPGSIAYDFANNTRYATGLFPIVTRGLGTIQHQMFLQQPTFISFEFGANEVLGAATSGTAASASPAATGAAYTVYMGGAMQAIHDTLPNARVALFTIPDVRTIPFFTTWPPITVDFTNGTPSPLRAWVHDVTVAPSPGAPRDTIVDAALGATDLVLLTAANSLAVGNGFQTHGYNYVNPGQAATGVPLDSALVLDVREQAVIANAIATMNAAVDGQVAAKTWIAKVDFNALLTQMTNFGYDIGGTHYSTDFVTGGLFSLDGVHPTDLGHAIIANAMVDAVNARFGSTIPHVHVADYETTSSSAAHPAPIQEGGRAGTKLEGLDQAMKELFGRR